LVVLNLLELYLTNPHEMELRNASPLPSPEGDQVKIKLIYGGICGSDLKVLQGKVGHAAYPLRPGHELIGIIINAGEHSKYPVGTRVVVLPNTFCGECDLCQKGHFNICRSKESIGINTDGGFAEEFTISSKFVLPIPEDLSDERAILIEPFAVVVHALKKVTITKGTKVAIVGCGNEGMLSAALALHLGAEVTALDINPQKFNLVKKIGDVRTVRSDEMGEEAFDVVIEAAGVKSSVEQGLKLVRPGGSFVLIGLAPEANIPITHLVRNEITIYGSIIYNFPEDYVQTITYLKDNNFNVAPIISKVFSLKDFKEAYDAALSGDYGKVIFNFKEGN
jgi:L-iditol 2-dehydrogenase